MGKVIQENYLWLKNHFGIDKIRKVMYIILNPNYGGLYNMRDLMNENNVSAENQLPRHECAFYMGNMNAKKRLLIVGNSITLHFPKEDIGWYGKWGMAASAKDKDYVHVLQKKLDDSGKDVFTMVRQIASWERGFAEENALDDYKIENAFGADVVVFRAGENVPKESDFVLFEQKLREFIEYIAPKKVIFTSTAWESELKNAPIINVAAQLGAPFIDLTEIGRHDEYMARGLFEHKGVANHPGDKGMEYIADKIFEVLKDTI